MRENKCREEIIDLVLRLSHYACAPAFCDVGALVEVCFTHTFRVHRCRSVAGCQCDPAARPDVADLVAHITRNNYAPSPS